MYVYTEVLHKSYIIYLIKEIRQMDLSRHFLLISSQLNIHTITNFVEKSRNDFPKTSSKIHLPSSFLTQTSLSLGESRSIPEFFKPISMHNETMSNVVTSSNANQSNIQFKLMLLTLLVVQNTSLVLLGRYCRSKIKKEDTFVVNHLVIVTECAKVCMCMTSNIRIRMKKKI